MIKSAKPKSKDKTAIALFESEKSKFSWLTDQAHLISNRIRPQVAAPLKGYATWLFIRACVTAGSLVRLFEPQDTCNKAIQYLDHASIGTLARALIENIAVLMYFADPTLTDEEWWCRKHLIDLHDLLNRVQFLTQIPTEKPPPKKFVDEMRNRLLANPAFMAIPAARRKRLLDGEDMFVHGRHQAMLVFGWGDQLTRGVYKYLSSHAHSTALAFHRTQENRIYMPNSGASSFTAAFAVEFARKAFGRGCLHMLDLFPYVEATFDPLVISSLRSDYLIQNNN